jgi:hypothetical protein
MTYPFIKIYNSKYCPEFCDSVIKLFEKESDKVNGVFGNNTYNINTKNTLEFKIPSGGSNTNKLSDFYNEWVDIDNIVHSVLSPTIIEYITEINSTLNLNMNDPKILYLNQNMNYNDSGHQIQKYTKNEGHYKSYHNDFSIIRVGDTNYYRILTYIIYLNTINEGGETNFFGNYDIKPTVGNIVIFPATWEYPHCGKMPLSDDKYIITGWIFDKYE